MPTTIAARSKLPTYCAFTLKRSFKIIEKFNRKFGICKAFSKTHLNFPPLHRTYQPGRSSVRIRHLVDEVFCDFFDFIKAKMTKFQSPQFNVCAFDNSRKKYLGWMPFFKRYHYSLSLNRKSILMNFSRGGPKVN